MVDYPTYLFFLLLLLPPEMEATHVGQLEVGLEQLQVAEKTVCSPSLAPDPLPCRNGTQRCSALKTVHSCQWALGLALGHTDHKSFLLQPEDLLQHPKKALTTSRHCRHSNESTQQNLTAVPDHLPAKVLTIGEGVHTGILHSLLA